MFLRSLTRCGRLRPLVWTLGALLSTAVLTGLQGCDDTTVESAARSVVALRLNPQTAQLVEGQSQAFAVLRVWSDGTEVAVPANEVQWSSSDEQVLTVDATGLVKAGKNGVATLKAQVGTRTATATLTVTAPHVLALHVTPTWAVLPVGATQTFAATAIWDNAATTDVSAQAVWAVDNESILYVTPTGVVTGLQRGMAAVTATYMGYSDTAAVEVQQKQLVALQIQPPYGQLAIGGVLQLNAMGVYSDGSTNDDSTYCNWTSSAPDIASVDGTGKVTAKSGGAVTISASLGAYKSSIPVTVKVKQLQTIQVTPALATVAIGGTQQLLATANYDDGSTSDITNLATWTSSDLTAVSVTASGEAKGLIGGKAALISAMYQNRTGVSTVAVSPASITALTVTPPVTKLAKGQQQPYVATANMSDGTVMDVSSQVTWTTSDNAVATITAKGLATGIGAGNCTVTAALPGKNISNTAQLQVTDAVATSLMVTPAIVSTFVGGPATQLTAMATFSDDTTANVTGQVEWTSSDAAVAQVSAQGGVKPMATGVASIASKFQGINAAPVTVFVGPAVVNTLEILPAKVTIAKGTTQLLVAQALLSDGSKVNLSSSVAWQSSDPGIATVSNVGEVTGIAPGAVTMTATIQGKFATMTLTVSPATLLSIDVAPASALPLPLKATRQYTAIGTYSDNSNQDITEQVTWTSSAPLVATVSNAAGTRGLVTALGTGKAWLGATLGTVTAPLVQVAVDSETQLASLTVWPAGLTLPQGQVAQLQATGHYTNGATYDVTTSAVWDVVDTKDVPVGQYATVVAGQVTALSSTTPAPGGSVRVRVRVGTISTWIPLVVKATTVVGIGVTCSEPLNCLPAGIGYQVQCRATANFDDGTTTDVTGTAAWTSSAPTIAGTPQISGGKAWSTIYGAGTAVITASLSGKTSSQSAPQAKVMGANLTLDAISLTPPNAALAKGFTLAMQASGLFSGSGACAGQQARDITRLVSWSSSIPSVASIGNAPGSQGLLTAMAPGTASITAVLGSISKSAQVTVSQACLQRVEIDQPDLTLPTQVVVPLTVSAFYSDAPNTPVPLKPGSAGAWGSSDVNPASWYLNVGNNAPGTLTFTVAAGACTNAVSDAVVIAVDQSALPASMMLQPAAAQIAKGGYQDYIAMATYAGYGSLQVSPYATWSHLPALGLSYGIAPNGRDERFVHQGTAEGTTTIAAAYKNRTATATLQVSGATIQKVQLTNVNPAIPAVQGVPVGIDLQFHARVTWSDGTWSDDPSGLLFVSSNPANLAFQDGGHARTLSPSGTNDPQVVATFGGVSSAPLSVHVSQAKLTDLQFSPASGLVMPRNTSAPLKVLGVYSDGTAFDVSRLVVAASGNATVVSVAVTSAGVLLTSLGKTTTQPVKLTMMKDTISRDYFVSVSGSCFSGLNLQPANAALSLGETRDFMAVASNTDGGTSNLSTAGTWTPSNALLANLGIVNGANRYRAIGKGNSTIGYAITAANICAGGDLTKNTLQAEAAVQVSDASVEALVILPQPIAPATARRIPLGERVKLTAWAKLSDGTYKDITADQGTQWSTQKGDIASVDAKGVLYGQGLGLTIVSAVSANGKQADLIVEVQPCGLPVMAMTTAALGKMPVGTTRQFAATAKYAAGGACTAEASERTFDVTAAAVFVSSDVSHVVMASGGATAGLATAVGPGPASVWASYRGVTSPVTDLQVVSVQLKSLQIAAASSTYRYGTLPITVTAIYTDGLSDFVGLPAPAVAWNLFDPAVASINAAHVLTGLTAGTTQYFAQVGAILSNKLTVTVTSACVKTVTLTSPAADLVLPRGVPFALQASCKSSDGSALACMPSFSVADPDNLLDLHEGFGMNGRGRIATAAPVGKTALLQATILAANGACPGENVANARTVTVGAAGLDEVTISPTSQSVARGMMANYLTQGSFVGGTGAGVYNLSAVASLVSNNPLVATPVGNGSGAVQAGKIDGTALISANYLGVSSKFANLTVSGKLPVSLSILAAPNLVGGSSASATYPVGGLTLPLLSVMRYSDDTFGLANAVTTWSLQAPVLANTSIAQDGKFTTGTQAGDQVVVASMDNLTAKFVVKVVAGTIVDIALVGDNGGPAPTTVAKGLSQPYRATFKLSGSSNAGPYWAGGNLVWAVGNAAVASLYPAGMFGEVEVLHALDLGTTSMTAQIGAATGGPWAITVTNAVLSALTCKPTLTQVTAGSRVQLQALATLSDGTVNDVSGSVDWNSAGSTVLSIDGVGLATAQGVGEALVKPKLGGLQAGTGCVVQVVLP